MSVKIRSDDDIDNYGEKQFAKEKQELKHVDGFKIVDEIKKSIEILMNMRDNGKESSYYSKSL